MTNIINKFFLKKTMINAVTAPTIENAATSVVNDAVDDAIDDTKKAQEEYSGKVLARINTYEIYSPHKDVFILRDESTKLVLRHGKFTESFKLVDLLKYVEKLPPIKLKHSVMPRALIEENGESDASLQETGTNQ